MGELQPRVAALVEGLVDDLETLMREQVRELAREQALAVLAEALGAPLPKRVQSREPPVASRRAGAVGRRRRHASVEPAGVPAPADAGRRSSAGMQRDMKAIANYVQAHPGMRMEEIAAAVGSTSLRLRLPMLKLISSGTLMKAGSKRGSRYWIRQ